MKLADQLPFPVDPVFRVMAMIMSSTSEPESRRITVKLEASMVSFPRANRASTELAANAINASPVKIVIFSIE